MALKSLTLTAAALMALGGVSFAATTNSDQHTTGGVAASKATTEIEKGVGAGDSLTAADLKSAVMLGTIKDAKEKKDYRAELHFCTYYGMLTSWIGQHRYLRYLFRGKMGSGIM